MSFINYVTQIQIDFGAVKLLQAECERVGIHKPLIVTDAGVKAAGVLQKALDALPGLPVTVFDQTPSNPTESAVRAAAAMYKEHHCDGLIAVGGGSAIDCAKGVAIAVSHEGPLKTYATIEGGSLKITDRVAPIIAVPTTSGTGSEVARGAILIVDDAPENLVVLSELLRPQYRVLAATSGEAGLRVAHGRALPARHEPRVLDAGRAGRHGQQRAVWRVGKRRFNPIRQRASILEKRQPRVSNFRCQRRAGYENGQLFRGRWRDLVNQQQVWLVLHRNPADRQRQHRACFALSELPKPDAGVSFK